MADQDLFQRFLFEDFPVRGGVVHLNAAWSAVLDRHDYPKPIRNLLGELIAAAALLSSTIKYKGSIIMQIQGDGPLSLLVAEFTHDFTLRGMAEWRQDVDLPFRQMVGDGKFVITIDTGEGHSRYQSIVPLDGDTVAEVLQTYLQQSEQLDTQLWLTSTENACAGMVLQKMPEKSSDEDAWDRMVYLAETLTSEELLSLSNTDMLHRLFHEETLRLFDAQPVSFRCSCSRERVRDMLRSLGDQEVNDILQQEGKVSVNCQFCNQKYDFDQVDAEQLFASDVSPEVPQTRH